MRKRPAVALVILFVVALLAGVGAALDIGTAIGTADEQTLVAYMLSYQLTPIVPDEKDPEKGGEGGGGASGAPGTGSPRAVKCGCRPRMPNRRKRSFGDTDPLLWICRARRSGCHLGSEAGRAQPQNCGRPASNWGVRGARSRRLASCADSSSATQSAAKSQWNTRGLPTFQQRCRSTKIELRFSI
jgi:hypothetical protein